MHSFRAGSMVVTFVAVTLGLSATASAAGCLELADKYYKKLANPAGPGCFVPADGPATRLDGGGPCPATGRAQLYFEKKADAEKVSMSVSSHSKTPDPTCTALFSVVRPDPAPGSPDAPATDGKKPAVETPRPEEPDAAKLLSGGVSEGAGAKAPPVPAVGTGATEAAAEAIQILGQIVVDRASQAGYRLLTHKIKDGLRCVTESGDKNPKTDFPATCKAIDSVRVQDLAMARDVLLRALASDVVRFALHDLKQVGKVSQARERALTALQQRAETLGKRDQLFALLAVQPNPSLQELTALLAAKAAGDDALIAEFQRASAAGQALDLVTRVVVPALLGTLSDPSKKRAGTAARAIADELVALGRLAAHGHSIDEVPLRLQPFVFAGAALYVCQQKEPKSGQVLAPCDISAEVDRFPGGIPEVKRVARSLARSLQVALFATSDNVADPDKRILAAMEGVFDAGCFAVEPERSLGCPAILDIAPEDEGKAILPLSLARGMLEAGLERDTNRMITTAVRGLELVVAPALQNAPETRKQKRALRLIAGLVEYANTFAKQESDSEKGDSAEALHEQRTKILESLTSDMTDRTVREGDVIASLGGSLALTAGARIPVVKHPHAVYNGPFALTLGFGLHNVPETGSLGGHLELGLLDLAQYLSYQERPKAGGGKEIVVREPKVEDAFSPSLKVGVAWGREVPVYLAVGVGYSPFYEVVRDDGAESTRGAITLGAAFGAYVPLIDLN